MNVVNMESTQKNDSLPFEKQIKRYKQMRQQQNWKERTSHTNTHTYDKMKCSLMTKNNVCFVLVLRPFIYSLLNILLFRFVIVSNEYFQNSSRVFVMMNYEHRKM